MGVIENIKKNGFKYITPSRIIIYLRSLIRKVTGYRIKEKHAIAFSEIITYKSLTCPDCVQLGYCRVCQCPVNELFTAMEAPCSDGKFPAFQESKWIYFRFYWRQKKYKKAITSLFKVKHWSENWKQFKIDNNIFLTIFSS